MKTFKEWIQSDRDTFFNDKEFGEKMLINGVEITVLNSDNQEKTSSSDVDYIYENHQKVEKELSIKFEDYALIGRPVQGEKLFIDNSFFEVLSLSNDDDTYTMKVQANK